MTAGDIVAHLGAATLELASGGAGAHRAS
jgi:hypothetical protein